MTALIVGGDHVESIRKAMSARGMARIEHWNGRKSRDLRRTLPKETKLIVLLYDYLSHPMVRKVNSDAADKGITIIHCRRSLGQLCRKLDESGICGRDRSGCELCIEQARGEVSRSGGRE